MATIDLDELKELALRKLVQAGVPSNEAHVAIEICADAEIGGKRTHGFRLLRNMLVEYGRGADRRCEPSVQRETPVSALYDGGFHFSAYVHAKAVQVALTKARQTGLALVGTRNCGVSGALGSQIRVAAREGFVAIACNSTPLAIVAPGGIQPILGTNPLAIALPLAHQDPLVLDLAMSVGTANQVFEAAATGRALQPGIAVDANGMPTTSATAALTADGRPRLIAMGQHKGFVLATMIELLCAGGLGAPIGSAKRTSAILEPSHFCGLYLIYWADLFIDAVDHDKAIRSLLGEMENAGVRIPGAASAAIREARLHSELLEVEDSTLNFLRTGTGQGS